MVQAVQKERPPEIVHSAKHCRKYQLNVRSVTTHDIKPNLRRRLPFSRVGWHRHCSHPIALSCGAREGRILRSSINLPIDMSEHHRVSNKVTVKSCILTSNRALGFPTMSKRRLHRAISVFLAHPTTTSKAASKWSKNSTVTGSRSSLAEGSDPLCSVSVSITVCKRTSSACAKNTRFW